MTTIVSGLVLRQLIDQQHAASVLLKLSDTNLMVSSVSLGYIGDPEKTHLLHRRFFPSKVGGKPAWLDPVNLPNGDEVLVCHRTGCSKQPLTFILQVYAARDFPDDAFHRTIYLFGCQWCSETFVALRCQLPRYNQFYPSVPSDKNDSSTEDECLERRCCPACGIPTNKRVPPRVEEITEDEKVDITGFPTACNHAQSYCHQDTTNNLSVNSDIEGNPELHHRCKTALEWVDTPIPVVFEEGELEIDDENLDPVEIVSRVQEVNRHEV